MGKHGFISRRRLFFFCAGLTSRDGFGNMIYLRGISSELRGCVRSSSNKFTSKHVHQLLDAISRRYVLREDVCGVLVPPDPPEFERFQSYFILHP